MKSNQESPGFFFLNENVSSVNQACRKRRLNGRFLGITAKGWPRVGAWTGTLKNPTKCLWRWEPDGRSNFFLNPPAHLCAITYVTEISLPMKLSNRSHSFTQRLTKPMGVDHVFGFNLRWITLNTILRDSSSDPPWGRREFKSGIHPPYPQRVVKGD